MVEDSPEVVECLSCVWQVMGSIPGQVIPIAFKIVLGASLLGASLKRKTKDILTTVDSKMGPNGVPYQVPAI